MTSIQIRWPSVMKALFVPTVILLGLVLWLPGCRNQADPPRPAPTEETPPVEAPPEHTPTPQEPEQVHLSRVLWTNSELMASLEERGLTLSERLGAESTGDLNSLSEHPFFSPLIETLEADLDEFRRADPHLGVGVAGNRHRLFDPAWLRGETTYFELVALVNRSDRRPLVDNACGEVRLVYRLAYGASRLPMTLTVDWLQEPPVDGSCSHAGAHYRIPEGLSREQELAFLLSDRGPAGLDRLRPQDIHRVQVNLQSVRWPSTIHPTLGGHAEYVLRSFIVGPDGVLVAEKLENTPDVNALRTDDELRRDLLAWIKSPEVLKTIDEGTARMPDRFLTERAISVAPRGHSRRQNHPFSALFSASDFPEATFDDLHSIHSGDGLLKRLDDHSCAGCHQGRALAGFHLLGEDPAATPYANALAVALSPHALDEERRRKKIIDAQARDQPADYARPFSLRDHDSHSGAYGTPCGLSDDPTFSGWSCEDGLRCHLYDAVRGGENHLGICLPDEPSVGDPCEVGELRTGASFRADQIADARSRPCPSGAVCNTNRVGFPGGMCTASCSNPGQDGRCGAIAILHPFNQCLARAEPFENCLTQHVSPAGLRGCDPSTPCRHDYICAQNAQGEGVCIPPYFLFQMRVDGHPTQPTSLSDRARRIINRLRNP